MEKSAPYTKHTLGFTLIELLVVISIIGVLATLLVANFGVARERARDAQRKSDLKNLQTALRLYYNDFGSYPASSSSFEILGCGTNGESLCDWGGAWNADGNVYMGVMPKDPLSGVTYFYALVDSENYALRACLENKSDEKGIAAPTGVSWNCPSGKVIEIKS